MTATIDRVASWAVPAAAVRVPKDTAERRILDWLRDLRIVVPEAEPIALRQTDKGLVYVPVSDAVEDEDVVLTPDVPDLDMLAAGCVSMVLDAEKRYPGPLSWRRWRLTGRVSSVLYASGVTRSGGGFERDGRDPVGSLIYHLPRLSDVLPRLHGTMRPYLLWKPSWWWECLARQGLRIRGRHRPEQPFAFGICAACVPCPYCGEHYECRDDCEVWG